MVMNETAALGSGTAVRRSIKLHGSALPFANRLRDRFGYKCGAPCVVLSILLVAVLDKIGLDGSIIRHLLSKSQSLFCRVVVNR
jgi:hypothetical protein